ncbi:hypothetical protein [Ralstonia phage RSF1]|uniref:Uncharacterized protein n=1 Tax=Ralstonia phage RSF1 TaxID=1689679 RepID=A0A146I5S8_9CAUD|nr:hypothetical protein AVU11_agp35 [Ralstonia phage RSF1]BAU71420.1 hypothetical protein [Ralstonia phage RSF1]
MFFKIEAAPPKTAYDFYKDDPDPFGVKEFMRREIERSQK